MSGYTSVPEDKRTCIVVQCFVDVAASFNGVYSSHHVTVTVGNVSAVGDRRVT